MNFTKLLFFTWAEFELSTFCSFSNSCSLFRGTHKHFFCKMQKSSNETKISYFEEQLECSCFPWSWISILCFCCQHRETLFCTWKTLVYKGNYIRRGEWSFGHTSSNCYRSEPWYLLVHKNSIVFLLSMNSNFYKASKDDKHHPPFRDNFDFQLL